MAEIKIIYEESHKIYRTPKIAAKMRQKGDKVSGRTVGKCMREIGIRACYRKHQIRTTRDSDFSSELKNIRNRDFQPEKPDAAWCTDITYIWTDRGVYTCRDYEEATGGMERSYSGKACPWDNACIESFHSLIKREWISRFRIIDYSHAYRLVFEYIEAFYNTVRIHSHCGYHSPSEYEKQQRAETEGVKKRIAELSDFLQDAKQKLTEYDENMVRKYIEQIKVYEDKFTICFKAKVETDINR